MAGSVAWVCCVLRTVHRELGQWSKQGHKVVPSCQAHSEVLHVQNVVLDWFVTVSARPQVKNASVPNYREDRDSGGLLTLHIHTQSSQNEAAYQ